MAGKLFQFFCVAGLLLSAPALASDRGKPCSTPGPDRVAACTQIIAATDRWSSTNRGWAYNNRGIAYYELADYDRAIADYSQAIRLNPKFVLGHNNLGLVHWAKRDMALAIASYTEAIRLDPKYVRAYDNRGDAYLSRGDHDLALADYNAAIRLDPKYAFAYHGRARTYISRGDTDLAIAEYGEAIRLNPKFTIAYNNRGLAYARKNELDRAIADYDTATRLDPKYVLAHGNRGIIYARKGEFDRAVAEYSEAIRLDPLFTAAFSNRGLAYERMGNTAKAQADFNSALAIPEKFENGKWAHDKARERLAAISSASGTAARPSPATTVTASRPSASNDRRIALVIGNSAYDNVPALLNPERDVALVAATLRRTGFESVTVQTNLRKEALISALRNFATQAEAADWAMVYFAGHGMEIGGINYLVPIDAKIAADRDIGFEAVPLEQVLNAAERARKLRLVILDACRDNPFANRMKRTLTVASRSVSRGLAAIEPEAGTLVVYAAKDGETALDGEGSNSPFATAFVANLLKPGLEVRRLFDFVRDDVMDATNRKQKPFSYGSISGRQDFYFVAAK